MEHHLSFHNIQHKGPFVYARKHCCMNNKNCIQMIHQVGVTVQMF